MTSVQLVVHTPAWHGQCSFTPAELHTAPASIVSIGAKERTLLRLDTPKILNVGCGPTVPTRWWRIDAKGKLYAVQYQGEDQREAEYAPVLYLFGHFAEIKFVS